MTETELWDLANSALYGGLAGLIMRGMKNQVGDQEY